MELTHLGEVLCAALPDDGRFPNSPLPLLIYEEALEEETGDMASAFEQLFLKNQWSDSWRNGVYDFHHYHSTAHEVLGVYRGWARLQLGGSAGITVRAEAGNCVVIPAGVAHKCLERSEDFSVVGGYPSGQSPDMCYGKAEERPKADQSILRVLLPECDPVRGKGGPIDELWRRKGR
jgi:uncharacterized protein YjlB